LQAVYDLAESQHHDTKKVIAVKILKVDEPKKHTEALLVKINSVALSTGR
jgi:hypothetical protein